ncbi:hypothetical protein EDF78_111141 [Rahnella sp. BIGb0236]|uniref:oligosaccharide repeat unit polymerase n=1 Tax=Rahnella sp. BIGb0236 TaxID=2485117 RepID=UPI0010E9192E|nr:oligosaccharide repeat unit polymerase [Rahnella sp. BIGb0236]TDS88337.1 hypothetical protein EDF78_111141 [Rahnella sp. BIGb0236]VTQ62304.1 Uncharacterised protein [Campylobacter jejuni]
MIRKYLMFLYVFFNLSCSVYFLSIGTLGGDFKYEYSADAALIILSCLIVLFTFLIFQGVIFKAFEAVRTTSCCLYNHSLKLDWSMLALVIIGIMLSVLYKIGVLGVNKDLVNEVPKLMLYFNTLFQPVLLVLIYLFYRCESKRYVYFLVYVLYIILILLNGQTGQLLILFCLFLIRKKRQGKNYRLTKIITLTTIGIALYPFVRMMKDAIVNSINSGGDLIGDITTAISGIDLETYFNYLFITLERFQMVSNTHFIVQYGEGLGEQFAQTGSSYSFYSLNWLVAALARFFNVDVSMITSAQDFMAYQINGVSTWSSQIGVIGYFYFYHLYAVTIIFVILLALFVAIRLSSFLGNGKALVDLTWCLSLMLICHGWFIPFLNYMQCLFLFVLFILVLNVGKSNRASSYQEVNSNE